MKALDHLKATVTSTHVSHFVRYCVAPALVFYAVSLAVMTQSGFTLIEILRDPAQQTKHSSFLGFVSSIGSWLWVAAATLCFFRLAVRAAPGWDSHKRLFALLGGFSLFLALDDFFLIHDRFITEGILIPPYSIFLFVLL